MRSSLLAATYTTGLILSALLLSTALASAGPFATADASASADALTARTVRYRDREIVPVSAKLRYTTLIVLPPGEQILDITCGDKEFWIINGTQHFAYVKPAKAGSATNLNLITASGTVYSFVVTEVSDHPDVMPDLKLFVELAEDVARAANDGPTFVSAQEVDNWRQQVELAKTETRAATQAAEREIAQLRAEYPMTLKFPYRFEARKRPFLVTAIYHDDRFTYIQATPHEPPALYELKDGQPNLVPFDFHDGRYVIGKVLDRGYLQIGNQQLPFSRKD